MRAYRAILSARFRMLLQYRAAALAGLATQIFWGWVRVMIFGAFYAASSAKQPVSFTQIVTYVWLGQGLLRILPFSPEPELRELIRSGNVVYELARPIDLYGMWYTRCLAFLAAPTALRCVPLFAVALLFFGMKPPASAAAGAAFLACLAAAVVLAAAIVTLATISLMWTVAGDGVMMLVSLASWMFSGMVLPLPLFPAWAQTILLVLPFRGIMDIPFRLYIGAYPPAQVPRLLAFQLSWAAGLMLLGKTLLWRGQRRLVLQGG